MAVEYDGGVILGADSRTTTGESIELVWDPFRIALHVLSLPTQVFLFI